MTVINYTAPPTVARFMKSQAFGRLIAGPVGSGKTTGAIFDVFMRACAQKKAPDGYRYTRFAILRQTLKQLKDTVLKDITSWLNGVASYKVSDNTIYIQVGDVRSEWLLIPLEDVEDQRRLLSMQLTGAWMSECIEMEIGLLASVAGRCGRYPSAALGGCTWFGIIADTNMPTEGSDWHKFMVEPWPDWEIFTQPGGLDFGAENLEWLTQTEATLKLAEDDPVRLAQGRLYYERLARSSGADWVRRYVHAKFGNDPSGTAVFRESFKMGFHVVPLLEPVAGHALFVGQDFGRDPCSIICQVDHKGRLNVLEEVVAEDIGLENHINRAVRPALMQERYRGLAVAFIGDPAGISKGSIYEETSFEAIKRLGFQAYPAPTNDIDPRLRSVDSWLDRQIDGGGAIRFDQSRCPETIRGMAGGYRYAKTKSGQRKPLPDKNEFSHKIDALQYVCLATHGRMNEMVARHMNRRPRIDASKRPSAAAWT